jgi:hypothetical protein
MKQSLKDGVARDPGAAHGNATMGGCESAVFYHGTINATRPCELNSWIQLFSSHGLVAFIARW